MLIRRAGGGVLSAFGRFNERGGGGGGGGAVHFRPIKRAGGGGCCPRACEKQGFWFLDIRGGFKPQTPLKLRAKKRNLDKRRGGGGGLQTPVSRRPCYVRLWVNINIDGNSPLSQHGSRTNEKVQNWIVIVRSLSQRS